MNKPSLDVLMRKVDNRYALVVITAKRARFITEAEEGSKVTSNGNKPVTIALQDIANDRVKFKHTRQGRK
ncbi:MAG TPA: DNA-directed RNA polymerase subunit omega [Desulfotomaculum sp.]|nr:MAG: DNA-directed RNA polymerase subunit omega [Desulfotomaculum sp. 46_80]KUK85081.1 MAG: DNA-directed RNA polymerase subunit omega [Desulfofundulus kuznetsovii]HAG09939.1 DNA-directed RNA polymerase subunit omega [Desulfotomaculum sp.]HBY04647.1 DNA-directed RNA polymerase subunit omega [Desulfotomaculum sp.]